MPMNKLLEGLLENEKRYKTKIDSTRKSIGAEMRRQRKLRGLSLRAAAEGITRMSGQHCDFSTLRKVETGLEWAESIARKAFAYYDSLSVTQDA
jgi:hypothetical protein